MLFGSIRPLLPAHSPPWTVNIVVISPSPASLPPFHRCTNRSFDISRSAIGIGVCLIWGSAMVKACDNNNNLARQVEKNKWQNCQRAMAILRKKDPHHPALAKWQSIDKVGSNKAKRDFIMNWCTDETFEFVKREKTHSDKWKEGDEEARTHVTKMEIVRKYGRKGGARIMKLRREQNRTVIDSDGEEVFEMHTKRHVSFIGKTKEQKTQQFSARQVGSPASTSAQQPRLKDDVVPSLALMDGLIDTDCEFAAKADDDTEPVADDGPKKPDTKSAVKCIKKSSSGKKLRKHAGPKFMKKLLALPKEDIEAVVDVAQLLLAGNF